MKSISNSNGIKKNKEITTSKLLKVLIGFFAVNIFVGIVLAFATGGNSIKLMFFHSGSSTDLFMDFMNSIRDGGSPDVYTARNNMYPPFCIMIFRFFSWLIDPNLVSSGFDKRKNVLADQTAVMIYFVFAIICILAMIRIIETYANSKTVGKLRTQASIFSFLMIISYPVLFCLERGNMLILSVIFAMFFMFFKDSENPLIRELSYISLACSAGIKIYPALFGLILIAEKKYKDAVRLMIYGIIIMVFPIVFFLDEFKTQPASIDFGIFPLLRANAIVTSEESSSFFVKLIKNLFTFATTKKSRLNLSSVSIQNIVFMLASSNAQTAAKIVCGITEVIALFCLFKTKETWKRYFLLTYLILNVPSASNSYALSFLIIPFTTFMFATKKYDKTDYIHLVLFALIFTPLPTYWYFRYEQVYSLMNRINLYYNTLFNQNIGTFVFQALFLLILISVIDDILNSIKKKKIKPTVNIEEDQVEVSA